MSTSSGRSTGIRSGRWSRPISRARLIPFLQRSGLVGDPPTEQEAALLAAAAPLVQERSGDLVEAADLLAFLFVPEDSFAVDAADAERSLGADAAPVLQAAHDALAGVGSWTAGAIEEALRTALIEKLGLKPRVAFGPVRVAVTGRRISPPLFESIELLGRERALGRLSRALAAAPDGPSRPGRLAGRPAGPGRLAVVAGASVAGQGLRRAGRLSGRGRVGSARACAAGSAASRKPRPTPARPSCPATLAALTGPCISRCASGEELSTTRVPAGMSSVNSAGSAALSCWTSCSSKQAAGRPSK